MEIKLGVCNHFVPTFQATVDALYAALQKQVIEQSTKH